MSGNTPKSLKIATYIQTQIQRILVIFEINRHTFSTLVGFMVIHKNAFNALPPSSG